MSFLDEKQESVLKTRFLFSLFPPQKLFNCTMLLSPIIESSLEKEAWKFKKFFMPLFFVLFRL